jgi:nucleoside 2-deoxyribosyltransferase
MKVRVYIAGPMTGIYKHNFPAFDRVKALLEKLGFEVVSPADIDREMGITEDTPFEEVLPRMPEIYARDLQELSTCKAIFMLLGWEASSGAFGEWASARRMGLRFMYENKVDDLISEYEG